MEGIIFIAILYFLFKAIVKKGKEAAGQATRHRDGTAATRTNQKQSVKRAQTQKQREKAPNPSSAGYIPISKQPYTPIQPTLKVDERLYQPSGSMGSLTSEGTASTEGSLSSEGLGGREGGEVFSRDVLFGDQDEGAAYRMPRQRPGARVLPSLWNADALVQAVVMSEVLNRPRRRNVYHG